MKIVIHPEFADAASFIKQLPQFFEQEGELLYDSRNKVKRYKVNGKDMVVKRYKRPNMIQRIVYTFFKKSQPLFSKKFNFFEKSFSLVVLSTNFFVLSQHIVVV